MKRRRFKGRVAVALLTMLGFGASCSTARHAKSRVDEPKPSDADSTTTVTDTVDIVPEIRLMYGPPVYFEDSDGGFVRPGAAREIDIQEQDDAQPSGESGTKTVAPAGNTDESAGQADGDSRATE